MLNRQNLLQFTRKQQTDTINVVREYCQHLFLSYLYQHPKSEKLHFKGGTALRIVFGSPRFSEDLDFNGYDFRQKECETLIAHTLANIEKNGIDVEILESKITSGGYLAIILLDVYDLQTRIQIEISFRKQNRKNGVRALIQSEYIPPYTLVHLPIKNLVEEKLQALFSRQKPRDFFDYFFLLSSVRFGAEKNKGILKKVLRLLQKEKINFRAELKKFLPASQAVQLRNFEKILEQKIKNYL